MRTHAAIWLLLALAVTGCATTRVVRLDTGAGRPTIHTPFTEDDAGPVELDEDEFEEAVVELARDVRPFSNPLREARQLFGVPHRGGVYLFSLAAPGSSRSKKTRTRTARACWSPTRMTR